MLGSKIWNTTMWAHVCKIVNIRNNTRNNNCSSNTNNKNSSSSSNSSNRKNSNSSSNNISANNVDIEETAVQRLSKPSKGAAVFAKRSE